MSEVTSRVKMFETEFAEDSRRRFIERLERAIELVKLKAPEIIIDMHMHLVNGSAAALLGEYNLREEAKDRQQNMALSMGRCRHCFGVRENIGDEFCNACAAEFDRFNAEMDAEGAQLCLKCGHERGQHYEYILNGNPQTRCKTCDPDKNRGGGDFVMESGSEFERLYHFADHDFEPMLPMA